MQIRDNIMYMSKESSGSIPYKSLGLKLQRIRQKFNQSISEVSGAVEIDEKKLLSIENGNKRPTEDILLLLIAHFNLSDSEAAKLWDLAGYSNDSDNQDDAFKFTPLLLVMPVDNKVNYSDKAEIVANQNGIVINFIQQPNGPYPIQTVARVGMSFEQALKLTETLSKTLKQLKNNNLPKNIQESKPNDNNPEK